MTRPYLRKVTRNGSAAGPPAASSAASNEEGDGRGTWGQRMRALLCCLAPAAAEQYYRRGESEAVVVRPSAHPPAPPLYSAAPVIGALQAQDAGKKTLVLDLDETLVHSSFKPIPNPDYIIPVRRSAHQPPPCKVRASFKSSAPAALLLRELVLQRLAHVKSRRCREII